MEYAEKIKLKDRTFFIKGKSEERVIYDCVFDDGSPTRLSCWMTREGFEERVKK